MDEVGTSREGELAKDESSSSSSFSTSPAVRWRPRNFSFSPYSSALHTDGKPKSLSVVTKRPAVARLTKDIVETYKICNPDFHYAEELNPKRFLTSPSEGSQNDGYDNVNSDLILAVNCVLVNLETKRRYVVKDILGHGTFGQVAKCWVAETNSFLAVKIIKNQPAYYQQALVEVSILTTLNKKYDPEDKHHIVRIHDYFVYLHHLCITFELLGTNLFELIKITKFQGLSLSIVQLFSRQILEGLSLMKDAGIIHCDLKPENILLCTSGKPAEIKIIDFGSACMEDRTVYSYIQSRYYRSPEVLLGYKYTTAIDMWSFGCIVAELFLGIPLFPGASEFDLLRRMIRVLGGQPPDHILKEAKNTSKFFKFVGNATHEEPISRRSSYQPLTLEEYEARELNKPSIAKEYFKHTDLKSLVTKFRYRTDKEFSEEDMNREAQLRLSLYDFLGGLLEFDPAKRWSPLQASKHPFMTGEPFTCPYRPPPESPRMPVSQNMRVDHHPAGGHWFAAGLSPNISGRTRAPMHNSPQYQMMPYGYSASYGSLGSHGSYNDGTGMGSSYGSYGDNNNMHAYFSPVGPSGMNGAASILGSSPEARRRMIQFQPGNGLGVSPSAGNFAPMSLGTSPSQFTPPSSYGQGSGGSPGHYGPTSPARGNNHGSPLGKVAAAGQFNRRKGWGHSGNLQSQESSLSSHWQGQVTDGSSSGHPEGNSPVQGGSIMHLQSNPNIANRKHQRGSSGISSDYSGPHNIAGSSPTQSFQFPRPNDAPHEKPEGSLSLPDPGDWDPNYSEELLLQEDGSDMSSMTSEFNRVQIGQSSVSKEQSSSRRYNRASGTSYNASSQRANGPIVSPPSGHDMHSSYSRPLTKPSQFPPHLSHISPSRLGQQPSAQRYNNGGRSATGRGNEWNHLNVQPPPSTFNSGGPHSPGSGYFSNDSWGRRGNIPPSASRGRKDYGRIT